MKINTDHHFWIGSSHKINQDYCLSGNHKGSYYAIVSDGCSSSPDTDIGARILARTALNYIDIFNTNDFKTAVISSARTQAKSLGLVPEALDATLLMAVTLPNQMIKVKCFGDGSLILITQESWICYSFSFDSGAPLYLNYFLNKQRYNGYLKEFDLKPVIKTFSSQRKNDNDFIEDPYPVTCVEEDGFDYYCDYDRLKALILCSDGMDSFYKTIVTETSKLTNSINKFDLLDNLLCFKNYNGSFINRRINKFLDVCNKNGWKNFDDVSLAGISFVQD